MLLTRDTRVTNHGFRNGYPTPRQSVLQAGQGVLVDTGTESPGCAASAATRSIRPSRSVPLPNTPGPSGPDFDPTTIIIIQQTTVIIDIFVVVDVDTGETIDRPAGTTGEEDTPHGSTTTSSETTTTSSTTIELPQQHDDHVHCRRPPGHQRALDRLVYLHGHRRPASAESELESQGCSVAELKALEGKPLPMTVDITVTRRGQGTGVVLVDFSSVSSDAYLGASDHVRLLRRQHRYPHDRGRDGDEGGGVESRWSVGHRRHTDASRPGHQHNGRLAGDEGAVGREGEGIT